MRGKHRLCFCDTLGGKDNLNQDNDFIVGSLESMHDNNGVAW